MLREEALTQDPNFRELWEQPDPLGISAARESMTGGAAALLAGFSIALIGVIAQAPEAMRWPGWSLLILSLAAGMLVTCVQCGFWARSYVYSRQSIVDWRPEPWEDWEEKHLRATQQKDFKAWREWESRAEACYHLGIVLLAVGLGLAVAPPVAYENNAPVPVVDASLRWAALGVLCASGVAQLVWVMGTWISNRRA
jgi:hypothetical protein